MDGAAIETGRVERSVKLVRTVQIELAFPLDTTWEEVGAGRGRLGVLRSVMHRLLNAGITGLMANRHLPKELQKNALGYLKDEVAEIEQWARDKGVEHLQSLALPSSITDRTQVAVTDAVKKYWKDKGAQRIPSFRQGAPIMIRDGGWSLQLDEQGRFTFAVKLHAGRAPHVRFAVRATKDWHYSLLKRIATDPSVKCGDCKLLRIERKASRKWRDGEGGKESKKWVAKLAFTTWEPAVTKSDGVMAVNRGRHNFLYAASTEPGRARVLMPGDELLQMKQKFSAIKWRMRRRQRVIGQGATAHGKARRYRDYEAKGDAEARYIRTTCQRAAAELVKCASAWGCGTVVIEDFNTIDAEDKRYVSSWPWYQLKTSIAWACKKAGLTLLETPSQYISSQCPRCGNLEAGQHNLRTGMFHCKACGFARPADLVATLNMLDAEADIGAWRKGFEAEAKLVARLKDDARGADGDGENESNPSAKSST